jgi:uncharacterized protein
MAITRLPATGRTTVNWASGTSTEIFIHPANATFAARDFLFRISTATVEAEESDFTFFEGITRHLMVLKGELDLVHDGHYSKHLKPFDLDVFSGEWKTRSRGKVTDFNLMLKEGATGALKHHHLNPGAKAAFHSAADFHFVYLVAGSAVVNPSVRAEKGDLIIGAKGTPVTVEPEQHCDIIQIEVWLPEKKQF